MAETDGSVKAAYRHAQVVSRFLSSLSTCHPPPSLPLFLLVVLFRGGEVVILMNLISIYDETQR